ncbi:MAG: HD domain-containing protein [Chloroflexota bacterium]
MMDKNNIERILTFLRSAEQLKNTIRSAHTSTGREESVAEHTWRLCLMAMLLANNYPQIDTLKLIKLCIIHDLGEAISGDIPAIHQVPGVDKSIEERKDFLSLVEPLPDQLKAELISLWDEYDQAQTDEAKLTKALDKIETVLQHTQGKNPADFDYGFNIPYGKKWTSFDTLTSQMRAKIDKDTARLGRANGTFLDSSLSV